MLGVHPREGLDLNAAYKRFVQHGPGHLHSTRPRASLLRSASHQITKPGPLLILALGVVFATTGAALGILTATAVSFVVLLFIRVRIEFVCECVGVCARVCVCVCVCLCVFVCLTSTPHSRLPSFLDARRVCFASLTPLPNSHSFHPTPTPSTLQLTSFKLLFLLPQTMDHWRGRKALGQLPHAVPQHVVIIRQGAAVETLRSDVVVGDVLLLSKGVLSDLHIVRSWARDYTTWWWQ